jgi:ATP-dependent Clp protease, protease subunit
MSFFDRFRAPQGLSPLHAMARLIPTVIDKTQHGERAYDIYSRMMEERIVMLHDQVDDQSASIIIAQLLFLDYKDPKKPIMFYINSPGGSVTAGLGIYDTMKLISAPVHTIAMGQACSMGAFLLAAGEKGNRMATPNATIMIHQPLGGTGRGQATDIMIQNVEMQRLKKLLTGMLSENSNLSYDEMYAACERDNFLTSAKALEMGLIDQIVGKNEDKKVEKFSGSVGH